VIVITKAIFGSTAVQTAANRSLAREPVWTAASTNKYEFW